MKLFASLGSTFSLVALILGKAAGQQGPICAVSSNDLYFDVTLEAQNLCSVTDIACICFSQPLLKVVEGCVLSSCTLIEALATQNNTQTLCGAPVRDVTHIIPIVTGTSGGFALLGVLVRSMSLGREFALDDIFAIAAMVSALPMGTLEFIMAADEIFYFMAITFTKMSFLFFCLRIFPRKELRTAVYALIGVTTAYGIAFTIACIFNCTPVSFIWTSWDGEHSGKCINFHVFAWAHAAINIMLDIVVIGVPIPEILRLSLSTKKKVYMVMMFSLGAFTTVVSIIRLQSLVQFASSTNPTYDNVPTAYWSVLEAFVGIFCICMPALRRVLSRLFPRCFGTTQSSSKYEAYNTPNKLSDGRPAQARATASYG
ncbi:hypothetical protein EK21DRAFT_105511 [Setomelanomma holmii]|uniref:Extracellular membrane protein CFEM domain-containing protein n=1 Tax=Setomelanomma holmii TaxID=210430 RepID=A0A9P4LFC9_9PLEO|nr:hypothetical protein EK21DRAFT_105511 [Setomelanomma holmii]